MTEAKPATDADVDHCRNLHSYVARALVARIDAERAARLAAEARVKALEDALRKAADAFDSYVVIHQDKKTPDGDRKAQANRDLSAMCVDALKEPAND